MKRTFLFLAACALLLTVGCEKDPTNNNSTNDGTYAYVLNEGAWGGNDAGISRLNIKDGTIEVDWFAKANGRGLGDLAQDLIYYGSRLYASVNGSNTIEVIDPVTGKSLKQIDMGNRGPRYLLGYGGKIYVTCYDKTVVRIDTATRAIDGVCHLSGMQPEQMCMLGGSLYVCNSWEYDANGNAVYDSTLSWVDIASFSEMMKLDILTDVATQTYALNPGRIKRNSDGEMFIACAGDYDNKPAQTVKFTMGSGPKFTLCPITVTNFDFNGNDMYSYATSYDDNWNPTATFYCNDTPILTNYSSVLNNAYGININPENGDIYVCNSPYGVNGDVYCFTKDGTERWHVEAGIFASKVVFVNNDGNWDGD